MLPHARAAWPLRTDARARRTLVPDELPMTTYDTVVIGSGPGGLCAALALARAGQRVLVCEQHYLPGGWAHSFSLDGYRFSPGVHYLGELGPGKPMRALFEGLGLGRMIEFCEMNPDGFDHYAIGGERFDVPAGFGRYLERLLTRFPHERAGLLRYHEVLTRVIDEVRTVDTMLEFPAVLAVPFRAPSLLRWGFRSLGALLDATIRDPLCRAVLAAQAGNYGLAPSEVSLPMHVGMHAHYWEGAYYPRGGAKRLPQAMIKALRARGGEIRLSTRVREILVEGGRATGVRVEGGEIIPARAVIANADPYFVYTELLPPGHRGRWERRARSMRYSVSSISVFCAVDLDLRARGYDSGNYWYYRSADLDGIYRRAERELPRDEIEAMFVAVPSLKDPSYRPHGHHVVEAFTFAPYEAFSRWAGVHPDARDPSYEALKHRLGELVLDALERSFPGFRAGLRFLSVGTPLANDFYCATRRGAIFGTAKVPFQMGPFSYATRTPVPNVLLCGASILSHGVAGALFSGLTAAAKALGARHPADLLAPPDGSLRIVPSEHPEEWLGEEGRGEVAELDAP